MESGEVQGCRYADFEVGGAEFLIRCRGSAGVMVQVIMQVQRWCRSCAEQMQVQKWCLGGAEQVVQRCRYNIEMPRC